MHSSAFLLAPNDRSYGRRNVRRHGCILRYHCGFDYIDRFAGAWVSLLDFYGTEASHEGQVGIDWRLFARSRVSFDLTLKHNHLIRSSVTVVGILRLAWLVESK